MAERKLTVRQLQILSACANDSELFYFPFAYVNYGGQVLEGARPPAAKGSPGKYAADREWRPSVDGREVAKDIVALVSAGLLKCFRASGGQEVPVTSPEDIEPEMDVYDDYRCVTFSDHIKKFDGYGPHTFATTKPGIAEIDRPEYDSYPV